MRITLKQSVRGPLDIIQLKEYTRLGKRYRMTKKTLAETIRDISYKQTIQEGTQGSQKEVIKSILEQYPEGITDLELMVLTGYTRASITARRNELMAIPVGYVKIINKNGKDRLNTLWSFYGGD